LDSEYLRVRSNANRKFQRDRIRPVIDLGEFAEPLAANEADAASGIPCATPSTIFTATSRASLAGTDVVEKEQRLAA